MQMVAREITQKEFAQLYIIFHFLQNNNKEIKKVQILCQ